MKVSHVDRTKTCKKNHVYNNRFISVYLGQSRKHGRWLSAQVADAAAHCLQATHTDWNLWERETCLED